MVPMTDEAPSTPGQSNASGADRKPVAMIIGALLGLTLGYVVLVLVQGGITLLWDTVPEGIGGTPAWYVIAVPLTAGILVFAIRRFLGDHGHSPLGGITISPLTPRGYLDAILAIAVSLLGGLVLGPEVALVSTGAVIGGLVAKATGADPKRVVAASAGGSLLALFVKPVLTGSLSLGGTTDFTVPDIAWAVPTALLTALVVAAVRWGGWLIYRAAGPSPRLWALVGGALVVSAAALLLNVWTDAPVTFVMTSGEGYISLLSEETVASTVLAIFLLKSVAYAASLGAGFRGGPFFPVMFVGAAAGLFVALVAPSGPSSTAAIVVGIVASVIGTAEMKWPVALILGAVIGFAFAGWALVPAAVVGAAVARAVPRFADRKAATAAAAA
jgi:H+/Cl- antiporter ClcA